SCRALYPLFFSVLCPHTRSTLFPYTTLFRSRRQNGERAIETANRPDRACPGERCRRQNGERAIETSSVHTSADPSFSSCRRQNRSEEHTSELQSQSNLVCRLLLEKKKTKFAT